jgi:hypothetical protein
MQVNREENVTSVMVKKYGAPKISLNSDDLFLAEKISSKLNAHEKKKREKKIMYTCILSAITM